MHIRGRLSAEGKAAEVIQLPVGYPEPPTDLTLMQAALWREIVAGLPPTWFRPETEPMLAAYCRHCVTQRYLARQRDKLEAKGQLSAKYFRLLAEETKLSGLIKSLATAMRLTHQSTYDKATKAKKAIPIKEPWDDED